MDDSEVDRQLATIRGHMPATYAAIQRAAKRAGGKVYATVRAGLRGTPNAFWACERGHVVGTPFQMDADQVDVAAKVCLQYGMTNLIFWSPNLGLEVET